MKAFSTILVCVILASAVVAAQAERGHVPGRLILELEGGVTLATAADGAPAAAGSSDLDALLKRYDVDRLNRIHEGMASPAKRAGVDPLQFYTIDFPTHHDLDVATADFERLASVRGVWKDELLPMDALPNDPGFANQWYLRNTTLGGKDIRALGGWAEALGDTNVVVAVVDSGVDYTHPDLGGTHADHVNGAVFTNWAEYYGNPGQDDDGNGKIDDFRGWDFVNLNSSLGVPGQDMSGQDNDPMDFGGHGTMCSGVIAASGDNGVGVTGVAYGSKILAIRAGYVSASDSLGYVNLSAASAGIIYAADTGADIVNLSFGGSSFLDFAIDYATDHGLIVVHSAGNDDSSTADPTDQRSDVLSVAALDQADQKASFSNYGYWIDVSAPGVNMYTTSYDWTTGASTYEFVDGTSFSAPAVAGAVALIWSANPGWTRTQVWNRLLDSCDEVDSANPGYVGDLGAGRVNLLKALGDGFHQVPEEFDYLYDAMNSAAPGDTIGFKASTALSGPVQLAALELNFLGGWDDTYTTRDPIGTPTVITANPGDTGLQVSAGATATTIVDGFRCTGGGGKYFNGIPHSGDFGGGVLLNGSSPTLRNIEVTGNTTGGLSDFGGGGGVLLRNSEALLDNVHVHGNTSIYGAGLYVTGGAPTLVDCVIEDNVSLTVNPSHTPYGGGLYVVDSDLTMSGCTISGHDDVEAGGGLYAGVSAGSTSLTLDHNLISDNKAKASGAGLAVDGGALSLLGDEITGNLPTAAATFMSGGGVYTMNAPTTADSVFIHDNRSQTGGGMYHGGGDFALTNSVIAGNEAVFFAGALNIQAAATGDLSGNTVVGNTAASASGGVYLYNTSPTVANNIIASNTGSVSSANGLNLSNAFPTMTCNDVWGNDGDQYGGITDPTGTDGNISEDPQFCDFAAGDYTLYDTSPCHPDNSGACGQIGAFGEGCSGGTSVEDPPGDGQVPLVFRVEPNFPNPFNPETTIRFALPAKTHVTVRVYDVAGRLVRTLVDEVRDASVHEVTWTGRDDRGREAASGVYFYRVRTDVDDFVDRMALLK